MSLANCKTCLNKLVLLILIVTLFSNCRKESSDREIEGVTGFTWNVYTVQEINDSFINPIPTSWHFQLNKNHSFSFQLGGAECSGTYSWVATDPASANVSFIIQEWNNPSQSSATADKLKKVLQGISRGYSFKPPFTGQNPAPPLSPSMVLQFQGSAGYFYVYR